MAEHLTLIVRAATAGDGGVGWVSALACRRRPGRRPCPGHLAVYRTDVPATIEWRCTSCGDQGIISGWERSPFDLRPRGVESGTSDLRVVVPTEVAATLRSLLALDVGSERLVFRAYLSEEGIELVGDEEDFGELLSSVAAEANHEVNRRRQKHLDAAFEVLNDALDGGRRS